MQLITDQQRAALAENGRINAERSFTGRNPIDFKPVVKLFNPNGAATWLLTETDPEDADIAFGLCDLGFGCPELGSVSLSEIAAVRTPLGLTIECDLHFVPEKTLAEYADDAREAGRIKA